MPSALHALPLSRQSSPQSVAVSDPPQGGGLSIAAPVGRSLTAAFVPWVPASAWPVPAPPEPVPADWPGALEPLTALWLDAIVALEQAAHTHPWTRGNFADALQSGYHGEVLVWRGHALGYYMAMQAVDEVHLLNIAVTPACQRKGVGRLLLAALDTWALSVGAQALWLEVRQSSTRARTLYSRHGYQQVGVRPRYYPARNGEREAAILMTRQLTAPVPSTPGRTAASTSAPTSVPAATSARLGSR